MHDFLLPQPKLSLTGSMPVLVAACSVVKESVVLYWSRTAIWIAEAYWLSIVS